MNKENDQPDTTWGNENEDEAPQTFRDAYLNAINANRPQPRADGPLSDDLPPGRSGNRPRPRSAPGGGRIYTEGDDRSSRPRPARPSRDEVYARLRQRPRQPVYARDQEETSARPPAQARKQSPSTSQREREGAYAVRQQTSPATPRASREIPPGDPRGAPRQPVEHNGYDEYEVSEESRRRPGQHHRRKQRRAFSTLLIGCLGGLVTLIIVVAVIFFLVLHNTPLGQNLGIGKSNFTQPNNVALDLGSASQLIVKNVAGNVTVNVDQTANSASLVSTKKVSASSQSDANSQFRQITLTSAQIRQGADPACTASSCLLITATVPVADSGGVLGGGAAAAIDLAITLPASFNSPDPLTPHAVSVNAAVGNIVVSGFNGILNLTGKAGNISVAHALIYAGTCIQDLHGDIDVGMGSFFDLSQPSNVVPCSNTTGSGTHPWFNIRGGVGNVAITLAQASTNLLLDANTNNGKISNDFGLSIPTASDGSATYHGPLLSGVNPTASLYLFTSTGNIALHKQ